MRRFLASLALAFGLFALTQTDASPTEHPVNSVAQFRSGPWGAYNVLNLLSYYDGKNQGGGSFGFLGNLACSTTNAGDIVSGQNTITNLSAPVYIGERIMNAGIPANTNIAGINFNRVLSGGIWTNASPLMTDIPDVTNILVGMNASGSKVGLGAKVVSKNAPATVITAHGTLHNGRVIHITSSSGGTIAANMNVVAVVNNDALPKVLPDSVVIPGLDTVASVSGPDITTTGSLGLHGVVVTDMTFRFTSPDGSVVVSVPSTGAQAANTPVLFYQNNAILSANATNTAHITPTLNGDDGGMHIVDSAGNCFVRQTASTNVIDWGAIPDNSTDSTAAIQNDVTYAGISTQPGPAGTLRFPAGLGIYKSKEVYLLKPVALIGDGRQQAIWQMVDGQSALTPLVYQFTLFDETNNYSSTYAAQEYQYRNLMLRAPNDAASVIGLYLDGYNSNPQVPDTDRTTLYVQDFTTDLFKSFGVYNARESGAIGRVFNMQIRGVTTANTPNDCFHDDGGDTWAMYDVVFSACDFGMYVNSPSAWNIWRYEAFSNNHAGIVTGTTSSAKNNAAFNLTDMEYGNNFLNNFVIDSAGVRVRFIDSTVNDTGTAATAGCATCNDIEITALASIPTGPVLTLDHNGFSEVHSEASGQNHLNNITFDDGASAIVAVDSLTTTSSPALKLWTNLLADSRGGSVCAGCTSKMIGSTYLTNIYPTSLAINQNTAVVPTPSSSQVFQLQGADGQGTTGVLYSYDNGSAKQPTVALSAAQGTATSPTAVLSGDPLGAIGVLPADGSGAVFATSSTGRLTFNALENFTASAHGTNVELDCTPVTTIVRNACFKVAMGGLFAPQATAPTVSGTGTPTIANGSTDNNGTVTGGTSATSIVITWAYTKANAPFCLVTSPTGTAFTSYTPATGSLTIALAATTGAQFTYSCWQH